MLEFPIRPRCRDAKARMDQDKSSLPQCGELFERLNLLAAAGGQRRPGLQEKRDIGPQRSGDGLQLWRVERMAEDFIQPNQGCGRIAAAAPQAGRQRYRLLQVDPNAIADAGGAKESFRRTINEI